MGTYPHTVLLDDLLVLVLERRLRLAPQARLQVRFKHPPRVGSREPCALRTKKKKKDN
jgi:hypothetical protein